MTPELLDAVASKGTLQNDSESARLIIDEVSMPRVKCLLVDAVLREVRHSELPMGGIQVVLVGDFFNCRLCRVALLVLFQSLRMEKPIAGLLTNNTAKRIRCSWTSCRNSRWRWDRTRVGHNVA